MEALILPGFLLTPIAGLFAVLLARRHPLTQACSVLVMSAVDLALGLTLMGHGETLTTFVGGWAPPTGIVLRADSLSRMMLLLTGVLFSAAALVHLSQAREGARPTNNPIYHASFPLLLLGLNGVFATGDFFNFYVSFELVAVSSYLLVSMGKHAPLEAAWKYSAQSVLGSILLLVGVVSLYGETGALEMTEVARRLSQPALWAAPFFLIAFLLKGAIFPFHFWQPDAHAAATTTGSVLLAGLLIKVGLYGLLRFWPLLMGETMLGIFLLLGALSVLFGATAAWRQRDAKRMLGFSSVSQLGFVLLGLGWGTTGALAAGIMYMVSHSLGKALLFLTTGALSDHVGDTRFSVLSGCGRAQPMLAGATLLGSLSLVGLPPTVGFMAKIGILREGVLAADWGWVALATTGSLMTAGYTLKAYQTLYWEPRSGPAIPDSPQRVPALILAAVTGIALLVVGGLVGSEGLWEACLAAAGELRAQAFDAVEAGGRP